MYALHTLSSNGLTNTGETCGPPLGCRPLCRPVRNVQAVSTLFSSSHRHSTRLNTVVHSNPKVYAGALHYLELPGEKCAMVAAHLWDLEAAAKHGMKTVYVPRPTDDVNVRDKVKSKAEGGTVDLVVDSFETLAELV